MELAVGFHKLTFEEKYWDQSGESMLKNVLSKAISQHMSQRKKSRHGRDLWLVPWEAQDIQSDESDSESPLIVISHKILSEKQSRLHFKDELELRLERECAKTREDRVREILGEGDVPEPPLGLNGHFVIRPARCGRIAYDVTVLDREKPQ